MKHSPRVLIADDDQLSLRKLEFLLLHEGFRVSTATDGEEALEQLEVEHPPSLAILDVLMPKVDGIEVCRRVRARPRAVPSYLILLTVQSGKEDVVRGLEAGANDYVTKPFDQAELLARLRVGLQVLTLQQRLAERVEELEDALTRMRQLQVLLRKDTHVYEFGDLRLEAAERRLSRSGSPLALTARVFDLLLVLVQNAGHLLDKEDIMREVWHDAVIEENNLTVSMSMLRKLLGDSAGRDFIETVPKRGYRFTANVRRVV